LDALERYQDASSKAGYLGFVPARILVRAGPAVQRAAASASHVMQGRYSSPDVLPDGAQRIYLFHVRKTAGSSLARSFLALGGEDPGAVERRISRSLLSRARSGPYVFTCGRGTLQQGDYFFGCSHVASHRLRLPRRTFTIALFRDPVARVLSYYRYLIAGDAVQGDMAYRVQGDERALAGKSFSDFFKNIPGELLLNQLYMYSRRFDVSEAADKILECSAIIMTETYERDLRNLASTLGLALEYRRERITALTEAPAGKKQLDILRDRLAAEYELLEKLGAPGRLTPAQLEGPGTRSLEQL
jgi:Sulfotransferase family